MTKKKGNGANLGFENQLWAAADKLRGHMDASEYKHVVLGLIFLKYISDAFQAKHNQLEATKNTKYTDPEDRDEYTAANIFWVPQEARWAKLQANAKQPTIGKFVNRSGCTLFIDARKMGALIDRTHRDFSEEEIDKIAATYHAWRLSAYGDAQAGGDVGANVGTDVWANLSVRPCPYEDVPGFCKSAGTDEIKEHGYVLTPGRYVGAAVVEDDGIPFEEKMAGLSATLYEQFAEADQIEATIRKNLEVLGYGG